jgi:hypothetical protein
MLLKNGAELTEAFEKELNSLIEKESKLRAVDFQDKIRFSKGSELEYIGGHGESKCWEYKKQYLATAELYDKLILNK